MSWRAQIVLEPPGHTPSHNRPLLACVATFALHRLRLPVLTCVFYVVFLCSIRMNPSELRKRGFGKPRRKSGTKITYNREMLLMLQQSPHSKSPINLTAFPGLSKNTQAAPAPAEPETVRIFLYTLPSLLCGAIPLEFRNTTFCAPYSL